MNNEQLTYTIINEIASRVDGLVCGLKNPDFDFDFQAGIIEGLNIAVDLIRKENESICHELKPFPSHRNRTNY